MLVIGGQPVNFNYATFDQAPGLFFGASVYDVTNGTPTLVGSVIPMTDLQNGVYVGAFTPAINHAYLVIMVEYDDDTYSTVDTNRSPSGANYEAYTADTSVLNFNYGAYDQVVNLTINATIFNLTNNTNTSLVMTHVANGVYMGQYQGTNGKQYATVKQPTDATRAPGSDSFQCFPLNYQFISFSLPAATLSGQLLEGVLTGQSLNATLEADV